MYIWTPLICSFTEDCMASETGLTIKTLLESAYCLGQTEIYYLVLFEQS